MAANDFEQIKKRLREEKMMEGIMADPAAKTAGHYRRELDAMPLKKMMDQVDYIDLQLLPAIEKKRGKDSEDYKFMAATRDSLVWAVLLKDRFDRLQHLWGNKQIEIQLLRQNLEYAQNELQKYCLLEDIWYSDFLDHAMAGVKKRVNDLKNKQDGKKT